MAAPDANRLRDALSDLLTAAAASLTDPPVRRYRSAGPPAVTCECLAVYAQPLRAATLAQPGEIPAPRRHPRTHVVVLSAELWRPRCTAANPDVAVLDAEGAQHAVDGWALHAGLTYRLSAGTVWTTVDPAPMGANVDLAELLEPQGQYVGWRVDVAVGL